MDLTPLQAVLVRMFTPIALWVFFLLVALSLRVFVGPVHAFLVEKRQRSLSSSVWQAGTEILLVTFVPIKTTFQIKLIRFVVVGVFLRQLFLDEADDVLVDRDRLEIDDRTSSSQTSRML